MPVASGAGTPGFNAFSRAIWPFEMPTTGVVCVCELSDMGIVGPCAPASAAQPTANIEMSNNRSNAVITLLLFLGDVSPSTVGAGKNAVESLFGNTAASSKLLVRRQ